MNIGQRELVAQVRAQTGTVADDMLSATARRRPPDGDWSRARAIPSGRSRCRRTIGADSGRKIAARQAYGSIKSSMRPTRRGPGRERWCEVYGPGDRLADGAVGVERGIRVLRPLHTARRKDFSALPRSLPTIRSLKMISPPSGSISRIARRASVDLPLPLSRDEASAGRMAKDTPSTARRMGRSIAGQGNPKRLVQPSVP